LEERLQVVAVWQTVAGMRRSGSGSGKPRGTPLDSWPQQRLAGALTRLAGLFGVGDLGARDYAPRHAQQGSTNSS